MYSMSSLHSSFLQANAEITVKLSEKNPFLDRFSKFVNECHEMSMNKKIR
jgi:hypothetical protein